MCVCVYVCACVMYVCMYNVRVYVSVCQVCVDYAAHMYIQQYIVLCTSNKNFHFEMILDVGIGEKRKETRFLICEIKSLH